jgi:hypothetical protein
MIPCRHWIDVESPEGGGCMERREFVAWEACRGCPLNPDPEGFPPKRGTTEHTENTERKMG